MRSHRGGLRVMLGMAAAAMAAGAVAWVLRAAPAVDTPVPRAADEDEGDDYGRDFAGGAPYTGEGGGPRGTDVRSSAA